MLYEIRLSEFNSGKCNLFAGCPVKKTRLIGVSSTGHRKQGHFTGECQIVPIVLSQTKDRDVLICGYR
jgi:hypothetical protein